MHTPPSSPPSPPVSLTVTHTSEAETFLLPAAFTLHKPLHSTHTHTDTGATGSSKAVRRELSPIGVNLVSGLDLSTTALGWVGGCVPGAIQACGLRLRSAS